MTDAKISKLINQGEQAAYQGDWESSKKFFQQAVDLAPGDLLAVNGLALSLLQSGQAAEAIHFYKKVISIAPNSADAYNNLGVAQLIAGEFQQSEEAYRQAIKLNPDHVQAWKNLAIVCLKQNKMEEGVQILASLVKAYPKDIEGLYLLGQCYQEAEEYDSARFLYEEALKIDPDFALVKEALNSIPGKSVDTSRIARAEHASKLSALKALKQGAKKEAIDSAKERKPGLANEAAEPLPLFDRKRSVAFFGLQALPGGRRIALIARLLSKSGCKTSFNEMFSTGGLDQYDLFVFSQPHISPEFLNGVMYCIQNKKPYGLDIDLDYHNLPEDHPAYSQFGRKDSNSIKALNIMLQEAAWVSVPSTVLAQRLKGYTRQVHLIPPAWDRENPFWEKPKPVHSQFTLGWLGTAADRHDLLMIKSELEDYFKKNLQVQLIIAGDANAYEMLDGISETRRQFLPAANPEDYPYILSQFDVQLIPLKDNLFNQAKSDLPLLEAGVLRLPWIASSINAFQEWSEGGLLAEAGQWGDAVDRLFNDEQYRLDLGTRGRIKAENREKALNQYLLSKD
ncbi:MAG: tetratricopeptide repeat protein [Chloroflexi bacterium]|nr:tetratricopeptide repeat protein [Chloroflexota bacterium]